MKKFFLKNLVAVGLVIVLTTAFYLTPNGSFVITMISDRLNRTNFSKITSIESIIDRYYMGEHNPTLQLDRAIHAYVNSLGDRYGAYLNKSEYSSLQSDLGGEYRGIGITANAKNGKIHISKIKENSPAQRAGLMVGDYIISINSKPYSAEEFSEAISLIKSLKENDDIVITIERNGVKSDIKVKIEKIETPYVSSKMIDASVGYIRIDSFGNKVGDELENALNSLGDLGMKALVLDLRANPGGTLVSAVDVCDIFLGEAEIVRIRDKNGKEEVYKSDEKQTDEPICVLVDGQSASASEVVAAALKDNGRAILVGEKTFGKGVVQSVFGFNDGTGLRLTTAKYYTPSGVCIDGTGIEPDIKVELSGGYESTLDGGADPQLEAAISAVIK